jgi:hypothetical protein
MLPELQGALDIVSFAIQSIKKQLEGLDRDGLNFVPEVEGEANSIYTTILHTVSSYTFILYRLAGKKVRLEGPEFADGVDLFKIQGDSAERLIELLDQAEQLLRENLEDVTEERLNETFQSQNGLTRQIRFFVMLMAHHGSNHLGHIELTRQLYLKTKR